MERMFITIFFLVAGSVRLPASPPDSTAHTGTVVEGSGHSYRISAPKGWILEHTGLGSSGKDAQLYPQGSTFANSASVMFVVSASKKAKDFESVDNRMQADAAKMKRDVPNITITRGTSLTTKDHKSASVRVYGSSEFLGVAYLNEDSSIVMFYVKSKDKRRFDNAMYSLKDLVGSYAFIKNIGAVKP